MAKKKKKKGITSGHKGAEIAAARKKMEEEKNRIMEDFPGWCESLKRYDLNKYKELISVLFNLSLPQFIHTVDDFINYINNFDRASFASKDIFIDSRGQVEGTNLLFIAMTVNAWIEDSRIDLVKLNKRFAELNEKIQVEIDSFSEKTEFTEAVSKILKKLNSNLGMLIYYHPESISFVDKSKSLFVANLRNGSLIDNLDDEAIRASVENYLNFALEYIEPRFSEIKYKGYKEDALVKNVLNIINLYPCVTADEIVHIVKEAESINIFDCLIGNTIAHDMNTVVWDRYQFEEDTALTHFRNTSLQEAKQIAKEMKVDGRVNCCRL